MLRYVLRLSILTAVFSPFITLLFGDPHWYWSPLVGLACGAVVGVVLWLPHKRLLAWLERNDEPSEGKWSS